MSNKHKFPSKPNAARLHVIAEDKYQKSPEQVKKRENRNKARYQLEKKGVAHKGDGKDVMHVNGNALDNRPANWKLGSRHKNRAYPRVKGAHKKFAGS